MRILLVDDDDLIKYIAERWLHEHELTFVQTMAAAINACDKNAFDLILCDVHIPPNGPGEVAEALRQFCVPVIEISVMPRGSAIDKSAKVLRKAVSEVASNQQKNCIARAREAVTRIKLTISDRGQEAT